MTGLEGVDELEILNRLLIVCLAAFVYIYIISFILGQERRNKWFHKRKTYTFFNKKGFLGEYLNYGYPCTWQGLGVALIMYGVIFGVGYWYVFLFPYK